MAEIGTPAAMRPMTGTTTGAARSGMSSTGRILPRLPSITLGEKPLFLGRASAGVIASGRRTTSSARARLGRRRMKPRSSSALINRWMPDLDRRSSASFISSNEGGTPASFSRSWMNMRSSYCFRVSIWFSRCGLAKGRRQNRRGTKHEQNSCSPCVPQACRRPGSPGGGRSALHRPCRAVAGPAAGAGRACSSCEREGASIQDAGEPGVQRASMFAA
mgnify:CR=1 FL=1